MTHFLIEGTRVSGW